MNWRVVLLLGILAPLAGCNMGGVETTYGRTRGKSVNGTKVLAEWLRARGHNVRTAIRLTDDLEDEADVVVRFAPYPGPPGEEEGDWYEMWLMSGRGRQLIYIPQDFDAEADYWRMILAQLPADAKPADKDAIDKAIKQAAGWPGHLPSPPKRLAEVDSWFEMEPRTPIATACQTLEGPWAEGVDAAAATIPRHDVPKLTVETPLLTGDGKPLAMTWHTGSESQVLVVANGSFLLNAGLLNKARRPLAERVVDWVGDTPRRVVFVEGRNVAGEGEDEGKWPPEFHWIARHLVAFGLIACLARAVRLGRPRPEPPSGADRPVAHAEALGHLLYRAGDAAAAQDQLETYRRWRQPSAHSSSTKRAPRP